MATAQKTALLATPIGVAAESQSTAQQGWLPLTKANKRPDKSTVVTSKAYDVRGKIIVIELDYVSWGGNGGQGLVVYLFDASAPAAGSGGIGGVGLGYVRMIGAYIGIGLDESGSFSSIDAKNMSETTKDSGAGNFVTVRGSQERNFARDGMFALSPQMPLFYEAARYASRQKLLDGGGIRHVVAKLTPKKYLPGYTVDLIINGEFIVQEFDYPYAVPASVKAGIAATNGDRTSNHEIKNFDFNLLDPVGIECPENGNVLRNTPAYICHSGKVFAYPQLNDGDHVHQGWDGVGKWGDIPDNENILYGIDTSGAACLDSDGLCAAPAGKGAAEMNTVVIYCCQDDGTQQEPSDTTTFSQYGATDFRVEVREENSPTKWIPVATGSSNNLVRRIYTFPRRRCLGVQVIVSKAAGTRPSLVGLEAYNR